MKGLVYITYELVLDILRYLWFWKLFLNPLTADIWVGFASQPAPLQTTCSFVKIWQLIVPDIPRKTGYLGEGGGGGWVLEFWVRKRVGDRPLIAKCGAFFKTVLFCPVLGLEPVSQTGTPQTRPPPLFFSFFSFFSFSYLCSGKKTPPLPPLFSFPLKKMDWYERTGGKGMLNTYIIYIYICIYNSPALLDWWKGEGFFFFLS